MNDIVDDLRREAANPVDGGPTALLELAADEIETLRLELQAYRAVVQAKAEQH